jgi:hypothetical protein
VTPCVSCLFEAFGESRYCFVSLYSLCVSFEIVRSSTCRFAGVTDGVTDVTSSYISRIGMLVMSTLSPYPAQKLQVTVSFP